jgi:hypothetical protein
MNVVLTWLIAAQNTSSLFLITCDMASSLSMKESIYLVCMAFTAKTFITLILWYCSQMNENT